ncbi:hypothetical protein DFJ74DRAFT_702142 [Hyaloraphidium curvatum]|nr:hypothetical protein DFJ74DRAFT_702142 [Hyaloraphidium curvatum]
MHAAASPAPPPAPPQARGGPRFSEPLRASLAPPIGAAGAPHAEGRRSPRLTTGAPPRPAQPPAEPAAPADSSGPPAWLGTLYKVLLELAADGSVSFPPSSDGQPISADFDWTSLIAFPEGTPDTWPIDASETPLHPMRRPPSPLSILADDWAAKDAVGPRRGDPTEVDRDGVWRPVGTLGVGAGAEAARGVRGE